MSQLDPLAVNTLRFLAVDAVEAANSGHPGLPLGAAPIAHAIWDRFLRHNPANPDWANRDRFILSAGHGSALLYALLHLHGYDLPIEEVKNFRQWGSRTPGHPEYGHTAGVEATTGPLGQGFAMGVGMALAEKHLSGLFNRDGFPIVDHHTYGIVSDGDLMEGISYEAASLAGFLGLGKMVYLYDDNDISIDGSTDITFKDDIEKRFEACHWHVQRVDDANDIAALEKAIAAAKDETTQPSIIIVRSHIGYGSPKQDTAGAHGAPLGADATRQTKEKLGWPLKPAFHVPDEVRAHYDERKQTAAKTEAQWDDLFSSYKKTHPDLATQFEQMMSGSLPDGWDSGVPHFSAGGKAVATRAASSKVMNALAKTVPGLIGGSADLAESNKTRLNDYGDFGSRDENPRNIHFGIREHAMGAIVNGLALHGGIRPYGATFLIFSDYVRPSIRLAALMNIPSTFVFTHDSIGLGEDGPTHQPVEQTASLRAIPGLTVIRPADANETAAAWRVTLEQRRPVALVLSRQNLPILDLTADQAKDGVARGGYVLSDAEGGNSALVMIATGSEVQLALAAQKELTVKGVAARVVSMPSCELFDAQPDDYRATVLPAGVPCLSIEAGSTVGWHRYADDVIGFDKFGASAPGGVVMEKYGFTVDNVVSRALTLVETFGK